MFKNINHPSDFRKNAMMCKHIIQLSGPWENSKQFKHMLYCSGSWKNLEILKDASQVPISGRTERYSNT